LQQTHNNGLYILSVDLIKRNKVQASSNRDKSYWLPVQRLWSVKQETRDIQNIALNSLTKKRNLQTIMLWQNSRDRLWINYVNKWLTWEANEQRINDVMVKAEEAMKKW